MFHTLKAFGSIIAHMLSRSPMLLIRRYVGISPPPKNMVMMKIVLNIFFPLKSSLDIGYAQRRVINTDMTLNKTE